MKSRMHSILFLIVLFVIAALAGAQVLTQTWTSVRVGSGTDGTALNVIECHNLAFVEDTTSTATTNVSGTYYIADAWKSSSADHGKVTVAISDGLLTATAATATTGTLSVMILGAP